MQQKQKTLYRSNEESHENILLIKANFSEARLASWFMLTISILFSVMSFYFTFIEQTVSILYFSGSLILWLFCGIISVQVLAGKNLGDLTLTAEGVSFINLQGRKKFLSWKQVERFYPRYLGGGIDVAYYLKGKRQNIFFDPRITIFYYPGYNNYDLANLLMEWKDRHS